MSRNLTLNVLRGIKANIPALNAGELYLATDEVQLYVGTASGNQLVLCNTIAVPTGGGTGVVTPKHKAGDAGPVNPQSIVAFTKIVIGGTAFWIPLMQ